MSTSADNKSRPFCSPRCKVIDLDRWLTGSYRVPGPPLESSSLEEGARVSNGFEIEQSFERKGDDEP